MEHTTTPQAHVFDEPFPTDPTGLPEATRPQVLDLADGDWLNLNVTPVAKGLRQDTVRMLGYNGSIPGPTLRVRQGTEVVVNVTNDGDLDTTVHWHGLRLENKYDGVRWIEKALSGFFHLLNGTTLLAIGLSVLFGQMTRRWLGWVGVVAGIGFLVGGVITSKTGFSPDASRVLTPALLLSAVFLVGTSVSLRRAARR